MRLEPLSRLSAPRLRVLDRLRLVKNNHAPVDVRQTIRLLMQEPVAEDQDVHRFQASENVGPSARRAEAPDREAGGEMGQLVFPIVTDRRWRDDQTGAVVASSSMAAMACTVLPSPISSARQAPACQCARRDSQRNPSSW